MILHKLPRPEHPFPISIRDSWHNLNGQWEFAIDNDKVLNEKSEFPLEITVPFAPESILSGIGNTDFMYRVWYRRYFKINTKTHFLYFLLHYFQNSKKLIL